MTFSFDSGVEQIVACSERYLQVSLPDHAGFCYSKSVVTVRLIFRILPLAGNTSPLLNMSGASFEDIASTGGRYGSV